jgi:hypothetical protein
MWTTRNKKVNLYSLSIANNSEWTCYVHRNRRESCTTMPPCHQGFPRRSISGDLLCPVMVGGRVDWAARVRWWPPWPEAEQIGQPGEWSRSGGVRGAAEAERAPCGKSSGQRSSAGGSGAAPVVEDQWTAAAAGGNPTALSSMRGIAMGAGRGMRITFCFFYSFLSWAWCVLQL